MILNNKHKDQADSLLKHLPEINKDDYTTLPIAVKVHLLKEAKGVDIRKFLDLDVASILIGKEVKDNVKIACFEKICSFDLKKKKLVVQGVDLENAKSVERLVAAIPANILAETRYLDISSCYALTNLAPVLSRFENLEKLNISGLKLLKSLEGIEKIAPTLKKLNASDLGLLKSVSGLDKCEKLRYLNLSGARLLDDIRSLKSLVHLEVLLLDNCYKMDFFKDFLPHLSHLKKLSAIKNKNFKDISLLLECRDLEKLDISFTSVTSIKSLLQLPELEEKSIKTEGCELSS